MTVGLLALCTATSYAQDPGTRVGATSPTAASLGEYGDVPVGLYTGSVQVSVPLFEVRGNSLALPVSLSYHGSGVRVSDIGGWAGLGWALNAGGVITRSVRGVPDEDASRGGYSHEGHRFAGWGSMSQAERDALVIDVGQGELDGEPDAVFFNVAGRSGQIVMAPEALGGIRVVPHQDLDVEYDAALRRWTITDESGTAYVFADAEWTTDYSTSRRGPSANRFPAPYVSSWFLSEVRSGGETITLDYVDHVVRHEQNGFEEDFSHFSGCRPEDTDTRTLYQVDSKRLVRITARDGVVDFAASLRDDARAPLGDFGSGPGPAAGARQEYRLDRITLSSPEGAIRRRFDLSYGAFPGDARLRLDAVTEVGTSDEAGAGHRFEYDPRPLPDRLSYAVDHWGYYNGETANDTAIPTVTGPGGTRMIGADREPDGAYATAGILRKVIYPTGGHSTLEFEPHDYGSVSGAEVEVVLGPVQRRGVGVDSGGDGGDAVNVRETTISLSSADGKDLAVAFDAYLEHPGNTLFVIASKVEVFEAGASAPIYSFETSEEGVHRDRRETLLAPGDYVLRATAPAGSGYEGGTASLSAEWQDRVLSKKQVGGGLRIRAVWTGDGTGSERLVEYEYTFTDEQERSSGVIINEPTYGYSASVPGCSYFARASSPFFELGSTQGSPVGYAEVTVRRGPGEHGSTTHFFRTAATPGAGDLRPAGAWPMARWTRRDWKRGQQTRIETRGANGELLRVSAMSYAFDDETGRWAPKEFPALAIKKISGTSIPTYFHNPYEVISAAVYIAEETATAYASP